MGVIIKYQLEFPELTVSNDLFSGEFILDADITAEMERGAIGSKFDIKLSDLPLEKAKELNKKLQDGELSVVIRLGYFDGSFDTVMEGMVKNLYSRVINDQLITSMCGFELGTHALLNTKYIDFKGALQGDMSIMEAVKKLLEKVTAESGIDLTPEFDESISDEKKLIGKTPRCGNLMEVLSGLARQAGAELLVCDQIVRMGNPIINDGYQPPKFHPVTNLAEFQGYSKTIPAEENPNLLTPVLAQQAEGFLFTVTGDHKLRPAQKVLADVDNYDELAGAEFRIHSLTHQFTTSGGYTCKGKAAKVCTSLICRALEFFNSLPSAETVIRKLQQKIQSDACHRPANEIGQVQSYNPGESSAPEKHLSTLYFNQRFEATETQPSLRAEVDADEQQLLSNKPLVSPFAWHKCGLVVPVYPGMKALLNHNLNLPDDALITGFLWSQQPLIEPPQNKEGDWWLCLPIDFDASQPPTDSTKAANDLIANNGKRVIEVKGLKITVGADKLPNAGERPREGNDDEFLIEHASGAKILMKDGEIQLSDGKVTLKISDGKVDIS